MNVEPTQTRSQRVSKLSARVVIGSSIIGLIAMWIYAFGFASKVSVNKIGDTNWTTRAEAICGQAMQERLALSDLRRVSDAGTNALAERAVLIDKATDSLEKALNTIASTPPEDAKGKAIVPLWIADYRVLIQDRRDYANQLRNGVNTPFSESMIQGLPISEKLSTFAADNRMSSCKAPIDLSI